MSDRDVLYQERDYPDDGLGNNNELNIFGYRSVDDYWRKRKTPKNKCVDCKYYNKDRRNEDGLARCSKHPFWVKYDDTCVSFETENETLFNQAEPNSNGLEYVDNSFKDSKATFVEETSKKASKTKSIIASIPLSILGALEVHFIYGLTILTISLVFILISYIPILKSITELFFAWRGDTPDMVSMLIATGIAYLGTTGTANRLIKNEETRKFTLMLAGIYLIIFNLLFVIINLMYSDPILANIYLAIAGIALFHKGKTT